MRVVVDLAAWAVVGALFGVLSSAGCGDATNPNPPLPAPANDGGQPASGVGRPSGAGVGRTSTGSGSDAGSDGGRRALGDASLSPGFGALYTTIFAPTCAGGDCHNPGSRGGVSVLTQQNAYNSLIQFVVRGDSAASDLYRVLASGKMPPGGPRLSSTELADIAAWIDAGALAD